MDIVDGRACEVVVANWLDGRLVTNSGAGRKKGDMVFDAGRQSLFAGGQQFFRADLKSTARERFAFRPSFFEKLDKRALVNEMTVVIVAFCLRGMPIKSDTFVIVWEADFPVLTEGRAIKITHTTEFTGKQCTLYAQTMGDVRSKCPKATRIKFKDSGASFVLLSWIDFAAAIRRLRSGNR